MTNQLQSFNSNSIKLLLQFSNLLIFYGSCHKIPPSNKNGEPYVNNKTIESIKNL